MSVNGSKFTYYGRKTLPMPGPQQHERDPSGLSQPKDPIKMIDLGLVQPIRIERLDFVYFEDPFGKIGKGGRHGSTRTERYVDLECIVSYLDAHLSSSHGGKVQRTMPKPRSGPVTGTSMWCCMVENLRTAMILWYNISIHTELRTM